jgi:hypothetical protein
MRTAIRLLGSVALVVVSLVAVPTAAQAAPSGEAGITTTTLGMTIVGFDPAVAKANGYEVRTGSDGKQYPVMKGGGVSTNVTGTVYGNCGSSYVTLTALGNRKVLIETGFNVIAPAYDYSWTVHVIDNYGASNKYWGSALNPPRPSWLGTNLFTSSGTGYMWAGVTSGVALLTNGWVCYSGNPSISTTIR